MLDDIYKFDGFLWGKENLCMEKGEWEWKW